MAQLDRGHSANQELPHPFKNPAQIWGCCMAIFLEHRENAASLYLSEDSSATLIPSPHASHSQRLQLLATIADIVLYTPTILTGT